MPTACPAEQPVAVTKCNTQISSPLLKQRRALLKILSTNTVTVPNVTSKKANPSPKNLLKEAAQQDATAQLLGPVTHQICSLIFFPCNSTVLILKSIPKTKKERKKISIYLQKKQSHTSSERLRTQEELFSPAGPPG